MPVSATGTGSRVEKPGGYSLKATWQAISGFPTDHFPLVLPGVHPLAAFFILRRLKRLGYSDCRVQTKRNSLIVHAHR
jgi:hypothetical protein